MFSISLGTNNRPKRNGNIYAYAKFWRDDKKYYGIFWKRPIGSLRRPNIKRNNSSVIWFSSTMLRLGPSNSSEKHDTISYNLAETRGDGAAVHRPNTTKQVKSRTNKKQQDHHTEFLYLFVSRCVCILTKTFKLCSCYPLLSCTHSLFTDDSNKSHCKSGCIDLHPPVIFWLSA